MFYICVRACINTRGHYSQIKAGAKQKSNFVKALSISLNLFTEFDFYLFDVPHQPAIISGIYQITVVRSS